MNVSILTPISNCQQSMSQQRPVISTSFSYETLEETLDIKPQGAQLHIGIPKETAFQENRIALTPDAVGVLISNGHHVVIEHNAGDAAHFRDKDYSEAGAKIVYDKAEVFKAPILVKSAPIVDDDLPHLQLNQQIISPIHMSVMKAELLESYTSTQIGDQWNDFVAVFIKDGDKAALFPHRILDRKTDYANGVAFGQSGFSKHSVMPEDKKKLAVINQIIDNKIKVL